MSDKYNEELKKIVINQYKRKKEEYELSNFKSSLIPEDIGVRSIPSHLLRLESVGFDSDSRIRHHTVRYEVADGVNSTPIYRRGDSFKVKLTFNRPYNPQYDSVYLIVSYGPNASFTKGTKYSVPLLPSKPVKNVEQWGVWIEETNGNEIIGQIFTQANCLVGIWRFRFAVSSSLLKDEEVIEAENIFYILFNPWCEDDEVYMPDEKEREEYVMRDYGNIFQGTYKQPSAKPWTYGQFDFSVLPAIFLLLEKSTYPASRRGSAAIMVRSLAAVLNANDDDGLLIGKWIGDFSDGVSPDEWPGSVSIFDRFLNSGGSEPVKYAQCWVFAGCLTTACRAIGIPCRTVTCFQSAHDGDQSLTVCYFYNQHGDEVGVKNSIWNYHVWNEVWINRHDLPDGYSGWQAADATPQEKSKDLFRVGPTPLKAVRNGDLGLNYDVPFVFAEVNADIRYFQVAPGTALGYKLIQTDTETIGILIVTDSIMRNDAYEEGTAYMETLNDSYKPSEANAERTIFFKALRQLPHAQREYEKVTPLPAGTRDDISFTIGHVSAVVFGEKFDITVNIESQSSEKRTVEIRMNAKSALYTGSFVTTLKKETLTVHLQPFEKKEAKVVVNADDYSDKLHTASHIKMSVVCSVQETQQLFTSDDTFEVIKPKLEIKAKSVVHKTTPFLVTFFFKNPFSTMLTNCTLTVEAGNMQRPTVMEISNVPGYGEMEKTIELMPRRVGNCVIVAVFKSDNQSPIRGSAVIEVQG